MVSDITRLYATYGFIPIVVWVVGIVSDLRDSVPLMDSYQQLSVPDLCM